MMYRLTRRELLAQLPAAAALLAAHESLAQPKSTDAEIPKGSNSGVEPRIRALRLLTAVPLTEMRQFYREKIGFHVVNDSAGELTLQAGATRLTFVKATPDQIKGNGGRGNGEPMYHFAFNIPVNKILAARKWQLDRTPLVPPRGEVRDSSMPDEVWHFRQWNAHSVFFLDPAWNIVEYIARHDLKNDSVDGNHFDVKDILHASEIGYVTTRADQSKTIAFMRETLGLNEYPRGAEP